ncbi:unnamed protein product [Peronospora destructor]|uniref:Anaphase-promoting complex subunit 1 N-terminal domain-containing protein n=1 Tax=Peronospora destructor TaxID=86335 RepID=A0AAV0TY11_9STRA|nr:unnamed protein product [Peronospora destructor]
MVTDAPPSIRVRCAGVRSNKHALLPSDNGRIFFSESQYSKSPFLVRVSFDSVSFVHRGTHVVERRFVFPGRVLHAVLANFSAKVLNNTTHDKDESRRGQRQRKIPLRSQNQPHLCVLVRSDCLNVYSAAGEVFEVALPFQANRLFPMEGRGLLLQRSPAVQIPATPSKRPRDAAAVALARKNRRASTSNRGDGDKYKYGFMETGVPARPRYFTLRHPLDEVKPVALSSNKRNTTGARKETFLSDSALDAVDVLKKGASPLLVAFHRWEQRFYMFQMNIVQAKSKSYSRPTVKVVDGPTWTRYRARSNLEELRVRIEPEWMAVLLWNSPQVGPPPLQSTHLSPILSPPLMTTSFIPPSPLAANTSSISSGNLTKRAFIASGIDGFPLLCIMDKDSGTLFLEASNDDRRSCEGEVDIKGHRFEGFIDIVVLEKTGALMLYRAYHPICRLVLPGMKRDDLAFDVPNEDGSDRKRLVGNIQLHSVGMDDAYEIVFPNLCGSLSGKIWRCKHPLTIVGSPLLQQVFQVLDCIVPPTILCAFKAQVICRAQLRAQCAADDDELVDGGIEWQSFCEHVIGLLPRQGSNNNEMLSSVADEIVWDDGERAAAPTCSSSFDALCQSEYHDMYQYEHAMLFATMELPIAKSFARSPSDDRENSNENANKNAQNNEKRVCSRIEDHVKTIFVGLHLLSEEFKLSIALFQQRLHLLSLLLDMGLQLGLDRFVVYYREDNCILKRRVRSPALGSQSKRQTGGLLSFTAYGCVPDVVVWLQAKMTVKTDKLVDFPTLSEHHPLPSGGCLFRRPENPLRRTRAMCRAYELMYPRSDEQTPHLPTAQSNAFKLVVYLTQDPVGSALSLDDLPIGLSFSIFQSIRQVKHHPPLFITEDICAFVGREDLSIASAEKMAVDYSGICQQHDLASSSCDHSVQTKDDIRDDCDGLGYIIGRSQPLFPADQRMKEVARLLRSSQPLCLKLEKTPDLSDLDYAQQQQARLLLLCKRSMALSVARGMVTLGSFDISAAQTQIWRLQIPALPLAGRKPPANAIVELDLSGYAKELAYWPQFHNGCATGLRLPAHDLSGVINRHWIKYHRPSVNESSQQNIGGTATNGQTAATRSGDTTARNLEEAYAAHAGLLLGIGLRGHLKCLSMADVYNYLSLSNEFVTVAIMLGMATTAAHCRRKRKQQAATASTVTSNDDDQSLPLANERADVPSLDTDHLFSGFPELSSSDNTPLLGTGLELALERSVSKMLCLHVPSLLPPPFGGFSVPVPTQTAALLGLGILYEGTGYRLMTELLLTEIARSPSSSQLVGSNGNVGQSTTSFDQLEGYALAAGMALGLVVLGRGQTTTGDPGLADLKLEEKLHKYIVGGAINYRDLNAAGSCLYRGRRWQAFGSGGNNFNFAVNGSVASNGSPNDNNTEASPGAGRDTKHSNDRSGARGGGEHVNIGVTGCASALALAFMYMQTDNKTVAAQLAVPDTLILLEYVRPDILLVRTLAKNLVMWSNIPPTTEWIDQHEVPAQLYQAYKSIQDAKGDANRLAHLSGSLITF